MTLLFYANVTLLFTQSQHGLKIVCRSSHHILTKDFYGYSKKVGKFFFVNLQYFFIPDCKGDGTFSPKRDQSET